MLAVTIDTLPGFEIRTVIGEVVGATVRPWNTYTEGVRTLSGATNPTPRMDRAVARHREEAIARMVERAYRLGANAVVGMRFDHRSISDGWNEICAYGTAVVVVPAASNGSRQQSSRPEVPGSPS